MEFEKISFEAYITTIQSIVYFCKNMMQEAYGNNL